MANPPQPPPGSNEGFRSLYNSPTFSDITVIILNPYCRASRLRIHAHKAVLAAGSSKLKQFFENNPTKEEVHMHEICNQYVDPDVVSALLKNFYGLPLCTPESVETSVEIGIWWAKLCIAANKIQDDSLRDHAAATLDAELAALSGSDDRDWRSFFKIVKFIMGGTNENGETLTTRLAAKLCCRHYAEIREMISFEEQGPEIYEWMFKHMFAQHGGNPT